MGRQVVSPLAAESGEGADIQSMDRGSFVRVGSWNIEGMTELKLAEVCRYMREHSIDIMCMQETRRPNSDHYATEDGYLVVLSGTAGANPKFAGVGFVVSPTLRPRVCGHWRLDNRIASIKVRTGSERLTLCTVFAPHDDERPTDEKLGLYDRLQRHKGGTPWVWPSAISR